MKRNDLISGAPHHLFDKDLTKTFMLERYDYKTDTTTTVFGPAKTSSNDPDRKHWDGGFYGRNPQQKD